jgi:SAM-dependent methyltransferase
MNYGKIHGFNLDIPRSIEDLRKFHNWIKLQLIMTASTSINAKSLLDIAVGRGGDLNKWARSGLEYIAGIDSDGDAIFGKISTVGFDGAITRYKGFRGKKPRASFWKLSATDPEIFQKLNLKDNGRVYDIVSCQFAFHYFVENIDRVFSLISQKLRKGGMFIGTASDGDLIKKNLDIGNINLPIVSIIKNNDSKYTFNLISEQSGRVSYFDYKGAIAEYFLHKEYFIKKAKEHGLEPVEILNFSSWYSKYDKKLSYQEQIVSFFNFSFVFTKL